jgi:serine-type D-Ala-D-Ala carboxypeptidase (penicillin-binding protein 5/6)
MIQKNLSHFTWFIFSAIFLAWGSAFAQPLPPTSPNMTQPTATAAISPSQVLVPTAPPIHAKSYILMDANNGEVLAEHNMDGKLPPASLTKLMLLYLVSQGLHNQTIHLTDEIPISEQAWRTGGSKMFVKIGSTVPIETLLQGIVVASGNDACVALAEYLGGSEKTFVDMMNKQAQVLNLTHTVFENVTGIPSSQHYSSAYDLALLGRALMSDFPEYNSWYQQKWFTYNNIRQPNRNRLLWRYSYADGIKTGHTDEAGFCLVGSAKKDNMHLIAVILGAPNDEQRFEESIQLFNYGFHFYESHLIYSGSQPIEKPRIWFGKSKTIPAGVLKDLYLSTPTGRFAQVNIKTELNKDLKAPIQKGQAIGKIIATLNDRVLLTTPIVALQDDPMGGLWRQMIDHIAHFFHSWFAVK